MIEAYKLVLTHSAIDEKTGEQFKIDEPLCISKMVDNIYYDKPTLLNKMFDELLKMMERSEDGGA